MKQSLNKLLVVLCILFLFSGCQKFTPIDEKYLITDKKLVGKWKTVDKNKIIEIKLERQFYLLIADNSRIKAKLYDIKNKRILQFDDGAIFLFKLQSSNKISLLTPSFFYNKTLSINKEGNKSSTDLKVNDFQLSNKPEKKIPYIRIIDDYENIFKDVNELILIKLR